VTARDLQAEQDRAEFTGWFEAQGYPSPEDRYDGDEMGEAFAAGMQAARDNGDWFEVGDADAGTIEQQTAPELAEAMAESRERFAVIADMLAAFTDSKSDGYRARVSGVVYRSWRRRAGIEA
jgi:hypothetical protein